MQKPAYYNEIDKFAAKWLRNLIAAGHIAPGDVDERSIEDVHPEDLRGYAQCHFFAGIGVWSYGLRLAGWADDQRIWTASCPCQPFSEAGQGAGFTDERHLWPSLFHLIEECKPSIVVGEQVASKNAEPWIDLVQNDVESLGYAFGCVAFPSASIGAPHIRDRAYWLADADGERCSRPKEGAESRGWNGPWDGLRFGGLADTKHNSGGSQAEAASYRESPADRSANINSRHSSPLGDANPVNGFWGDADWLGCRDGRWRPVEPGTFPLVDGTAPRVGRLRAYGNAVNAQQVKIFMECLR